MLSMDWIKEHQDEVQAVALHKGIDVSISEVLAAYEQRKRLQMEVDDLRQVRNRSSRQVGAHMQAGRQEEADAVKQQVIRLHDQLTGLEVALQEAERQLTALMLLVPNIVSRDTPIGRTDADNVPVRHVGIRPAFGFVARDHVELSHLHDIVDIPRGVKTSGSRNYYLKGTGVLLHRAVQQLALDYLMQLGFTLMDVPLMVRGEALVSTGFFPLGKEQVYRIADEDKWLVGTSEVPLVSCYADEVIEVNKPLKLAAASTCFRSEVGSAGKDVSGLYRVHQFAKVEQVVICEAEPELSEQLLQDITRHAEEILQLLELPYRVMAVCTGDMAQKTYKQYDIETWMPSRQSYGETHSASNLHDFQARRANIRYRNAKGKLTFCHTLNNTAVATPRILIPLLENHQQEDGSIRIPDALQPYMHGLKMLVPTL
ncbi:serine--tRNA ligase [Paenibacillus taiwanensis]|uniref:serine--tRNA ligase n=1 Tax=Paenibacillus taiwanensis TaxID=401638 RepID=UPI0003FBB9D5|nr:serine--tRNA ligase [Paenibacillus taiwanensis]